MRGSVKMVRISVEFVSFLALMLARVTLTVFINFSMLYFSLWQMSEILPST